MFIHLRRSLSFPLLRIPASSTTPASTSSRKGAGEGSFSRRNGSFGGRSKITQTFTSYPSYQATDMPSVSHRSHWAESPENMGICIEILDCPPDAGFSCSQVPRFHRIGHPRAPSEAALFFQRVKLSSPIDAQMETVRQFGTDDSWPSGSSFTWTPTTPCRSSHTKRQALSVGLPAHSTFQKNGVRAKRRRSP